MVVYATGWNDTSSVVKKRIAAGAYIGMSVVMNGKTEGGWNSRDPKTVDCNIRAVGPASTGP